MAEIGSTETEPETVVSASVPAWSASTHTSHAPSGSVTDVAALFGLKITKNAVGCFAIHAAVDPECKHIVVETVHGSDVCVDIVCIGKTKCCMGFAEGD